jgi:hypothetical protein
MIIFGIDAGLTAPGFAVVETSDKNETGKVLLAECFIPEWKKDANGKVAKLKKTEHDAWRIGQIVRRMLYITEEYKPEVIVAELPTGGAKSGGAIRGMAYSTAMTVSTIEAMLFYGKNPTHWINEIVYISPLENKKGGTGQLKWHADENQGKWDVFVAITKIWPDVKWPMKKKPKTEHDDAKCWAIADALSCVATFLRKYAKSLPPSK